jgi:toxin CptA
MVTILHQPIEFSPSRYLAVILIAAHAIALSALLPALPLWAGAALAILLFISLLHYLLRDAWLRLPQSCAGLVLEVDGVVLIRRDGVRLPCRIMPGSLVAPGLTVLNMQQQGARTARNVVILPDSLDAESFRQLRVWLKWGELS